MKFLLRSGPREFELPVGRFLIGRSETCELPLDDPLVSRQHVALVVDESGVTLEDLGSRNGVKLNGSLVSGSAR
ncbi:MAG TPA: FHA domain-containing protein, partial [Polyangiaceae bacterium]